MRCAILWVALFATPAFAERLAPPAPAWHYAAESPPFVHEGLTIEANAGIARQRVAQDYQEAASSDTGIAGLSVGVGAWLHPRVALTLRFAAASVPVEQGLLVDTFIGPSAQLWFADKFWAGVGAGLGIWSLEFADAGAMRHHGVALDLRIGHTFFATKKHAIDASIEITPGQFEVKRETTAIVTSFALLVGYQLL